MRWLLSQMLRLGALSLFVLLFLLLGRPAASRAELFAEQLTPGNIAQLRVGGPDAIAGLDDWALGNGTLCAAISDPAHESVLSARGGVLIDLGHCGRQDDQWGVLQPMMNLSRENTLPVDEVRAEVAEREARIVTVGRLGGLRFETHYSLDLERPRRLRVRTHLQRTQEGDEIFLFGDVALHGNRQLSPFTLSTTHPELSPGFAHPPVDVGSPASLARAVVRADLHVLVGASELEPGIAYGWRLAQVRLEHADGTHEPLAHVAMNGEHFSLLGAYSRPLWLGGTGSPGLLELAQTYFMDLEPGDRIVYQREFLVGQRADVASVTDQLWAHGPHVTGRVDDASARLRIKRSDGTPISFVRPESDGRFAFRLPPDGVATYDLEVVAPDGRTLHRKLAPGKGELALGPIAVGAPARLALPSGETMRLVFLGVPPGRDPRLGDDLLEFSVGGQRIPNATRGNHVSLAGVPGDPESIVLAPGRYRVLATRGPEWSVSEGEIELVAGERRRLEIEPPLRLIEQPGWLSADLHVHSQASDDSALPLRRRIAAFAAQGADVIVATEHDYLFDYGPLIQRLGLSHRIASIVGVEVTSTVKGRIAPYTIGHANAFPLVPRPERYRAGAPRGEERRLRSLAADLRAIEPRPVLQLNHPREAGFDSGYGSFFTHLSVVGEPLDPTRPLAQPPNRALIEVDPASGLRDLDFDAVELLNGPSMIRYRLTRADWLSFLLQGEIRTATANSDSHSVHELVALPRNYVAYPGARGDELDCRAFVEAVRQGRVYGSTGPLLDVRLGDRGPGQRFAGVAGDLDIAVQAAPWVPVGELRVYLNGALERRIELAEQRTVRLPLRFSADAFVTVEVEGEALPDSIYAALAPGFTPFAFTNPIFVDHDGDGRWTPPGLPSPPPRTLSDPTAAR